MVGWRRSRHSSPAARPPTRWRRGRRRPWPGYGARSAALAEGDRLFGQRCAQCHGARGHGDGPAAAGLTPPPARLADPAVLAAATPLDVYRRITLGVPGTAMPPFSTAL